MEVFDQINISKTLINYNTEALPYLRVMGDKAVALHHIPGRIIQRYLDNFKFLLSQVHALVDGITGKLANV